MIYDFPDVKESIRQGDIFVGLPRIDISLQEVLLINEYGEKIAKWEELVNQTEPLNIIVPVRSIAAMVATQDCDAQHSRDITLCEIREFRKVELKSQETKSPKKWKDILTQHARINLKWFYLPPSEQIGFAEKMAVDFLVTIRLPREDLETLKSLRRGRLNYIAYEHFRERISEFFRRYPYDEWYALDKNEMAEYSKEYPDAGRFNWQT